MKKNKGITLTSLVIYIALIFVILAILMRITTYFNENIREMADVSFETEFNKLNIYLLDESKKSKNGIQEITEDGTQITFSNGNKYTYNVENKTIYLKNTIKICENIEKCLFEQKIADNGKDILVLTIKIGDIEKTVNYTIKNTIQNESVLPAEYQEVEYIESTGTQYIDTGYAPTGDVKIQGKVYTDVQNTEMAVVGSQTDGIEIGFSKTNNRFFVYSSSSLGITPTKSIYDTILEFTASVTPAPTKELTLNNIDNGITQTSTGKNFNYQNVKLNLFQYKNKYYFKGRLYELKIYNNNEIVTEFIPCYRKSDNVVGLYDTVNNKFYTNAGTGIFLKGEDKNTVITSTDDEFIREDDYNFNIEERIVLPVEYQQVEYIQSTGTQYINTEYYPDAKTNAKYKVSVSQYNASGPHILSSKNYYFPFFRDNANAYVLGRRGTDSEFKTTAITPSINTIYEYKAYWNGKVVINNQELGRLTITGEADTTPLYIGAYGGNLNYSGYILNGKIYYCKIYNGNTLVRNFVPCYRKSDNVVGLYDAVNNVFYTNAGTGVYTAGAAVN